MSIRFEAIALNELTVDMVERAAQFLCSGAGREYAMSLAGEWSDKRLVEYYISRQERMDRYNAALQGRLVHVDR